jgi:hypothetical protein
LMAIRDDGSTKAVATMLAALGASHEALEVAGQSPWLFWYRSMRPVLSDQGFPAVASKTGLMKYWRVTRTKPDICSAASAPPFCQLL